MKIVVGLGNPGPKYAPTRHNIGFRVLDELAGRCSARFHVKESYAVAECRIAGEVVATVKPLTFMNASGEAVRQVLRERDSTLENLLVVCDDAHLPLGKLRLRRRGSSGGHKGLQSVIDTMGTNEFHRLRVGIGKRAAEAASTSSQGADDEQILLDYVLSPFSEEEEREVGKIVPLAADAVEHWVAQGIEAAMMRFN